MCAEKSIGISSRISEIYIQELVRERGYRFCIKRAFQVYVWPSRRMAKRHIGELINPQTIIYDEFEPVLNISDTFMKHGQPRHLGKDLYIKKRRTLFSGVT